MFILLKLAVLSISTLLISFVSLSTVFPALRYDLEVSQMQSELMMTIPALAVIIFIFVSNWLTPKIGMKKMVLAGMILSGIAGIFPFFVQQYIPILISRFFLGAGTGLVNTWAVRYITLLFEGYDRFKMMGYRSSAEIIGQMIVAIIAGTLFRFGWHFSFLGYSIAFISAILILIYIPEIEIPQEIHEDPPKKRLPFAIYMLTIFNAIITLTAATIVFRFPAIATNIRGLDYNPGMWMSLWPIFSIIAAVTFGKLSILLGKNLLYLALALLILSTIFLTFSINSLPLSVIALFLHGVVPAWFFPFVFMTASKMTEGKTQSVAFSYLVVGIKTGVFLVPFFVSLIETLFNTTSIIAPYPVLSILLLLSTLFIATVGKNIVKKAYL